MIEADAALFVVVECPGTAPGEIDRWCAGVLVPQLRALPGAREVSVWDAEGDVPVRIAVCELACAGLPAGMGSLPAFAGGASGLADVPSAGCCVTEFRTVLTLRHDKPGVHAAPALLLVAMNVEPDADADFNDWYDREHIPALAALAGVRGARRYRADGAAQRYVAAYWLDAPDVQGSPAWKRAIDTPWASRVRPRTRDRVRFVCRRHAIAGQPA